MSDRHIITFIGAPAAGKSTRIGFLKDYTVISSAQVLLKSGIDLSNGKYIDDKIVTGIMYNYIEKHQGDLILDGFPRTNNQLSFLVNDMKLKIDEVYYINTPITELLKRAEDRLTCINCHESYTISSFKHPVKEGVCDTCSGKLIRRPDDSIEIFKKKIEVYYKQSYPLLDEYRKKGIEVIEIDGMGQPEEIVSITKKKKLEKKL